MPVPKLPLRLTGLLYPYHLAWWRRTLRDRTVLTSWNERHNAIFVHIPKTAGTSVLAGLGADRVFDTHAPAQTYRAVYGEFYSGAFRFAFVRNPWDRLASSFHFMRDGTDWPMQQDWAARHIGTMSFTEFVRCLKRPLYRAQVMAERFFWPQTFWLGGVGRTDGVDRIYRFEALDAAMQELCATLGIEPPAATPHLRKVEKPDFRQLYEDEEMIDLVGRLYRHDVRALGYRFAS
jgi:hypothetical protein